MLVLNATRSVKSMMSDMGTLISIKPGEFSQVIIASRNAIISAMKLGEPSEIGIVCQGSYELEISKSVSAAIPYLYSDPLECKSKLLDPSIDYSESLKSKLNEAVFKDELNKKLEEIKSLKSTISSLETKIKELELFNSNNDLVAELNQLQSKYNNLITEKKSLESNIKESLDEINNLNIKLNEVRNDLGSKSQELTAIKTSYSKLIEENKELKYQIESSSNNDSTELTDALNQINKLTSDNDHLVDDINLLNTKITDLTKENKDWEDCCVRKDSEIKELKQALKESAEQIESMRTSFNQACEKFRITKDENGDWIQITE